MELDDNTAAIVFSTDGMQLLMPNYSEMDKIDNHLIYAVALFHMLSQDEMLKAYVSDKTVTMLEDFYAGRKEEENVDEGLSE
jgi:hypothetical protein